MRREQTEKYRSDLSLLSPQGRRLATAIEYLLGGRTGLGLTGDDRAAILGPISGQYSAVVASVGEDITVMVVVRVVANGNDDIAHLVGVSERESDHTIH